MMNSDLAQFLNALPSMFQEDVVWGRERTPFRVSTYLTQKVPPLEYVTSVRAIVVNNAMEVLTCRNTDGETHVVPGGRREAGEELEETLRREILEETGWNIASVLQLGLWHFQHLAPRLESHQFPYPDFLQIIYRATATHYDAKQRAVGDYEAESRFATYDEVTSIRLEQPSQLVLLRQVLSSKSD